MAEVPDPTFGAGFNADEFRAAIRNAMIMGLPDAESARATFRWKPSRNYSVADSGGNPYDYTAEPEDEDAPDDVQVPVAVRFYPTTVINGTAMGNFDNPHVEITVLDEDYVEIEGADEVLLGGDTYQIRYVGPPQGLFTVTVYTIWAQALDER